jgi:hypothetical protein
VLQLGLAASPTKLCTCHNARAPCPSRLLKATLTLPRSSHPVHEAIAVLAKVVVQPLWCLGCWALSHLGQNQRSQGNLRQYYWSYCYPTICGDDLSQILLRHPRLFPNRLGISRNSIPTSNRSNQQVSVSSNLEVKSLSLMTYPVLDELHWENH